MVVKRQLEFSFRRVYFEFQFDYSILKALTEVLGLESKMRFSTIMKRLSLHFFFIQLPHAKLFICSHRHLFLNQPFISPLGCCGVSGVLYSRIMPKITLADTVRKKNLIEFG